MPSVLSKRFGDIPECCCDLHLSHRAYSSCAAVLLKISSRSAIAMLQLTASGLVNPLQSVEHSGGADGGDELLRHRFPKKIKKIRKSIGNSISNLVLHPLLHICM